MAQAKCYSEQITLFDKKTIKKMDSDFLFCFGCGFDPARTLPYVS